jgi:hypothetical protein
VSVIESSIAIKRRNGLQRGGRRLALRASLRHQLGLWLDLAWLGLAWLGLAWLGLAWLGLAWLGLAWLHIHYYASSLGRWN